MEDITTLYLVRHGETAANVTATLQGQSDVPLNENGLEQAALVGKRLRNTPFDAIWSSDLSRAAVTAQAIAGERKVEYTPLLREWDLGDWVGLTWAEAGEKYPDEMALFRNGDPEAKVPGGESRQEFRERGAQVLKWVLENFSGKKVLCVSHGGLLKAIYRAAAQGECHDSFLRTDNTCFCCLRHSGKTGRWQLVFWNDTAHLNAEALSSGW